MQHDRTLATTTLLRALLDSKKADDAAKTARGTYPTLVSEREESSPFTLREGLFHEPKTMPGFARVRSKAR